MPIPTEVTGQQQPYGPTVSFATSNILPPSSVYLAADDGLVLAVRAPQLNANLQVDLRILTPQGIVIPHQFLYNLNTVGSTDSIELLPQTEGFLLSAAIATVDIAQRGMCFVRMVIRRGIGGDSTLNGSTLIQGYVTKTDWLSFPFATLEPSRSGRGQLETVNFVAVNPGSDLFVSVPLGTSWIVRAVSARLTTTAVAGTRFPVLRCPSGFTANQFGWPSAAGIGPSSQVQITWAPGATALAVGPVQTAGLAADLELNSNFSIRTNTTGLDVFDAWDAASLFVERFIAD